MRFDRQHRMGPRGGGPGGSMGRGGPRGRRDEHEVPSAQGIEGWFAGRLPDDWFQGAPQIQVDRDEVLVVGTVPAPEPAAGDSGADSAADTATRQAEAGRIARFRESTREERIAIAREVEHRYGRQVAWGAQSGDTRQVFTSLSVPVMTRLRQPERRVLDTLVAAGVARSRSEALAWSVKLVGEHADQWLTELRAAITSVDEVRAKGPEL